MQFKLWLEAATDPAQLKRLDILKNYVKALATNTFARMTFPASKLPGVFVMTNKELKKVFFGFEKNLQNYVKLKQNKMPADPATAELFKKYNESGAKIVREYFQQADPNEQITIDTRVKGDLPESNQIVPVLGIELTD